MTPLDVAIEQIVAALREGKRVRAVLHPSTKGDAVAFLLALCGVDVSRSDCVREGEAGVFVDRSAYRYDRYAYKVVTLPGEGISCGGGATVAERTG